MLRAKSSESFSFFSLSDLLKNQIIEGNIFPESTRQWFIPRRSNNKKILLPTPCFLTSCFHCCDIHRTFWDSARLKQFLNSSRFDKNGSWFCTKHFDHLSFFIIRPYLSNDLKIFRNQLNIFFFSIKFCAKFVQWSKTFHGLYFVSVTENASLYVIDWIWGNCPKKVSLTYLRIVTEIKVK